MTFSQGEYGQMDGEMDACPWEPFYLRVAGVIQICWVCAVTGCSTPQGEQSDHLRLHQHNTIPLGTVIIPI